MGMTWIFILIAAICATALVTVLSRGEGGSPDRGGSDGTAHLRSDILSAPAGRFGLSTTAGQPWAVVMDTAYDEGCVSLVSLADGSASIYFSTGGGVIGGAAHPGVRDAAAAFVHTAADYLGEMAPSTSAALPAAGHTRFYVRTSGPVLTADALEDDLGHERHPLSALFYAGQEVITELRRATEKTSPSA